MLRGGGRLVAAEEAKKTVLISLEDFFLKTPPGVWVHIDRPVDEQKGPYGSTFSLKLKEMRLHCEHEKCDGVRYFAPTATTTLRLGKWDNEFITFSCKNCGSKHKTYSIAGLLLPDGKVAQMFKYGELPAFGPPTPKKIQALLGSHREHFFKGRRAENQGMGIAAFAYYRRVINGQKNEIFDAVIRVCSALKASPQLLEELNAAKKEDQFTKAVESIKHGVPDALLINGENPLTLIHAALSEGLHNDSDAECLELATSVRTVMTELAERLASALKEEAELSKAVQRLVAKKAKPSQN